MHLGTIPLPAAILAWLLVAVACRCVPTVRAAPGEPVARSLAHAPAPVDNPLKGLVPYAGQGRGFPCSLEFNYLSLRELMTGPANFDWSPLERLLDGVASRGRQTVFRVWIEYPRKPAGIPEFLLSAGLKTHTYTNTNTQPLPPALVTTPDYADPRLRAALSNFVHALGARYDGDPRIGFVTAGLLGTWGEWHTYPRNDLWASKDVQREVLDAYEAAFKITPVLLRYPAGTGEATYAPTHDRRLGYHDDSFAWATRHTGRRQDDWFFESRLRSAGQAALDRWMTQPIGGEIRPEAWTCLWDDPPCTPAGQEFLPCVEATHASWLMDTGTFGNGAFGRKLTPESLSRATNAVRRLGYELQIMKVSLDRPATGGPLELRLSVTNHGVAPFYMKWPVELGVKSGHEPIGAWRSEIDLRDSLPGHAIEWRAQIPANRIPRGRASLFMRVPNPMPGGKPLRFANATQDAESPGWLSLGQVGEKRSE